MFHLEGPTFRELARQALSSTQHGYDLLAPKFDHTPFRTPRMVLNAAAPHLGTAGSIDAALDVCCGTGAALEMLRPICRRQVTGIDFSAGMLAVARQRIAAMPGDATVNLIQADVLEMTFDSEFDLAVSFGALGHFRPQEQPVLIDRIARALRPGGRFVFPSAYQPSIWSRSYWLSRSFNAAMHVRNALYRPPFVMFYLTFLIPAATRLLRDHGFAVEVCGQVFPEPFASSYLVIAQKR